MRKCDLLNCFEANLIHNWKILIYFEKYKKTLWNEAWQWAALPWFYTTLTNWQSFSISLLNRNSEGAVNLQLVLFTQNSTYPLILIPKIAPKNCLAVIKRCSINFYCLTLSWRLEKDVAGTGCSYQRLTLERVRIVSYNVSC